jgi:hypothetical protein
MRLAEWVANRRAWIDSERAINCRGDIGRGECLAGRVTQTFPATSIFEKRRKRWPSKQASKLSETGVFQKWLAMLHHP